MRFSVVAALVLCLAFASAACRDASATSLADQGATAQGAIDGRSSASAAQNTVYSCQFTTVSVPSSIPSYVSSSGVVSFASKPSIAGSVSWTSYYKAVVSGAARLLLGNGLPSHTTGSFPARVDPNAIAANRIYGSVSASPTQASTPTCLSSGPVGVAFTGAVFYTRSTPRATTPSSTRSSISARVIPRQPGSTTITTPRLARPTAAPPPSTPPRSATRSTASASTGPGAIPGPRSPTPTSMSATATPTA